MRSEVCTEQQPPAFRRLKDFPFRQKRIPMFQDHAITNPTLHHMRRETAIERFYHLRPVDAGTQGIEAVTLHDHTGRRPSSVTAGLATILQPFPSEIRPREQGSGYAASS